MLSVETLLVTHTRPLTVFISHQMFIWTLVAYFIPPIYFAHWVYIAGQRGVKGEYGPSPIGLPGAIGQKGQKGREGLPGLSIFVDKKLSKFFINHGFHQALKGDLEIQA